MSTNDTADLSSAVTPGSRILDVLEQRPGAGRILRDVFGLPCEECVVAEVETLEAGARYYGHDVAEMVRRLNECPRAEPRVTGGQDGAQGGHG